MEEPVCCPHCGTKLLKTNWGNLFCPNCGKVDTEKESDEREISYVGWTVKYLKWVHFIKSCLAKTKRKRERMK